LKFSKKEEEEEFGQAWNTATSYASNTRTKEIVVCIMN
jgi:hypothetical protein